MDRNDWLVRLEDTDWKPWVGYMATMDAVDKGRQSVWALNLLVDVCERCGCPGHPELLPQDSIVLRSAMEGVLDGKSSQIQAKGVRLIRTILGADERCSVIMSILPRYRRNENVNRVTRQQRLILEDSLPKRGLQPWMIDLFKEIMEHDGSAHWRSSKTANQNLNMVHKFLRNTILLQVSSLEEFHEKLDSMDAAAIEAACQTFTDRFCATAASARRYVVVFNHIFHRVWKMLPERMNPMTKRRRLQTLSEIDERLSQSSCSTLGAKRKTHRDYFSEEELSRIRMAAAQGADRLRDSLIVALMECAGLRRMGVLNIQVKDVAELLEGTEKWIVLPMGRTLTKGRGRSRGHRFKVHGVMRGCITSWLNTPEGEGGRPIGPSPFLLPSSHRDNSQMSASTLTRIFKGVCQRAGLGEDPRAHLHAMRHSCAHSLARRGNTANQIAAVLGHKSTKVTMDVYLRDDAEGACDGMVIPLHWGATENDTNVVNMDTTATTITVCPPQHTAKPQKDVQRGREDGGTPIDSEAPSAGCPSRAMQKPQTSEGKCSRVSTKELMGQWLLAMENECNAKK